MKKLFTILLASASLAACQNDGGENPVPGSDRVTIAPIITRATEVDFEKDDQIGLTILRGETPYAENTCMTYADGLFSGNLTWYAEAAEPSTLVAYYPYDAAGAPTQFSVATDQTTGYGTSDLMASVKTGVTPSAQAVSMTFRHLLTKLKIDLTNDSGSEISSVKLQGSIPSATVDLQALTVEVDAAAAPADITAQPLTANTAYRAIVIPQEVAFTLVVSTAAGKTLTQSLASMTLKANGQYTVTARVTPDDLQVSVSGDIANWDDQGEIPEASAEVAFEEHLDENYFLYDGERYNTVTLANGTTWMAQNLRYVPEGFTPSADAAADSHIWYPYELNYAQAEADNALAVNLDEKYLVSLTDAAAVEKYGYLYDIRAALNGRDVTADNFKTFEDAQGICPPGWHIPNRAEYYDLFGATNPNVPAGEANGNKTDAGALLWDATAGYATVANAISGIGFEFSGYRFASATTTRYQRTIVWSGNSTRSEWYGKTGMTQLMTLTAYQPNTAGVPQFYGLMTTFSSTYPEGRLSLSYISALCGQGIRCVKDHDIDFYAKYADLKKPVQ